MHWLEIFFGTGLVLVGAVALIAALVSFVDRSFINGLLALSAGVCAGVSGILHFAVGIGAQWAKPQFRSGLYSSLAIPFLVFWLLAWNAERRKKK